MCWSRYQVRLQMKKLQILKIKIFLQQICDNTNLFSSVRCLAVKLRFRYYNYREKNLKNCRIQFCIDWIEGFSMNHLREFN